MEVGAEGLEPELERGRDAEVPTGPAQTPEQLGLVGLGRPDEATLGGDELDGSQVVDREPEVALQAAHSPTERQPGDAGVADDTGWADESVRLGGDVELAEECPAIRPGDPRPRIGLHAAHRRHVDEEAAVRAAETSRAVTAGSDRDLEVVVAGEPNRGGDFFGRRRASDDRGASIVDRVPEAAPVVVAGVIGRDDLVARSAQLIEVVWSKRGSCVDHRSPSGQARGWFGTEYAAPRASAGRAGLPGHTFAMAHDLDRFVNAQQGIYDGVLDELRHGRKTGHWMWFVFPQIAGLGRSAMSEQYAIESLEEARAYLAHPLLGPRLRECAEAVLSVQGRTAEEILGSIDAVKLRSSMTLFHRAAPDEPVYQEVLDRYHGGRPDGATDALLQA